MVEIKKPLRYTQQVYYSMNDADRKARITNHHDWLDMLRQEAFKNPGRSFEFHTDLVKEPYTITYNNGASIHFYSTDDLSDGEILDLLSPST